jgi:uncharacterized lipoprotein YddW (UPF0748 family)
MRLFFLVFLFLLHTSSHGQNNPDYKKAFWVVRDAVTSLDEIEDIIQTAVLFEINDIFVQVRALGKVYYESDIEIKSRIIKDDFDPLSIIINKAQKYNMRIHAWVNMFYIWTGLDSPQEKDHIYYMYQRDILRNCSFPSYVDLRTNGIEGYFLDPQSKEVQKYLLNLLQEIADKYNVTGIHLDYFRYPGVAYSFTPESRTNFRLVHFYDPLKLYCSAKEYVKTRGHAVYRYADKVYRNVLINALSDYLVNISAQLHDINPGLELSVAVKPDAVEAKHRYFQDWLNWIKSDICDFVVIMNYKTDWDEFMTVMSQVQDRQISKKVMVGVSLFNQEAQEAIKRLEVVRANNFAGWSLFSYNYLIKNKSYLESMKAYFMSGGLNGS